MYEAAHSDIYLGIFGQEYGYEDAEGVSPTEREFDKATEKGNHRIIFVKRCTDRNPKEAKFIKRVEEQLVRKGFNDFEELRTSVYSSLIRFLEDNKYLRFLPWDAFLHLNTNRNRIISYPSSGGSGPMRMAPKVAPKENSLKDTADCWRQ